MPARSAVKRLLDGAEVSCHDGCVTTDYWHGASTTHRMLTHLVWCPKYRRRVLQGKIAERLEMLFRQAAEMNQWTIHELSIQKDHVHMLLQTRVTERISDVVQLFKGGSSRVIRLEHPELEEFLWGDSFWGDGYFAETVGKVNEQVMRTYIQHQHPS